jgi:microcompartment protein CcmK/EutM
VIRGRVLGELWSTRKVASLLGRKLVLVDAGERALVAIDTMDAREGQEVLVALGSGARKRDRAWTRQPCAAV